MTRQRALFETPPDEPPAEEACIAGVVIPGPVDKVFDYLVPPGLIETAEAGKRLRVPFGKGDRPTVGYCVRLETRLPGSRRLKYVAQVLDARPLLSAAMLELTRWIADRWLCGWGQVLDTVVPAGVKSQSGTREVQKFSPAEGADPATLAALPRKQRKVYEILKDHPDPLTLAELCRLAGCTPVPVQGLLEKGLVTRRKERARTFVVEPQFGPLQGDLPLNPAQALALETILSCLRRERHETFVLHGVTGSGKTEVYLQAISQVVAAGRQAILLVPEISLTPQTVDRFRARFGEVAVLHSRLTDSERNRHWERIADGAVPVVVGARSAVFAPTPRLGLILLDEEHEGSFKQESAPRYHARDVALERARRESVPLVLGSATPSLETLHAVRQGDYRRLVLPERVLGRPLPPVVTLDLRQENRRGAPSGALSRRLREEMRTELELGHQVILLLNRRGFSTHLQCPQCGHVLKCEHCDIALTYHRSDELLLCHYCDEQGPAPNRCPECKFEGIRYSGLGTQRLEDELKATFPQFPALRMDTDSMTGPGCHERALAAFERGDFRILLGTQMIAKGLDFPRVTLVGVVNADIGLHMPDFRAAERTFQLIAQVAGRAGRGELGGRVLVQTFTPDHPAVAAAARHDYDGFARGELPQREVLAYPPYGVMVRIVVRGPEERRTAEFVKDLADRLRSKLREIAPEVRLLGPAPCPIVRLRDKFRFHLQLQGLERGMLTRAVREVQADVPPHDEIEWIVDVDPVSML